ncbi:MAG: pyruvate dehydrogenase (acetyl-transferring) E1 component subunit alpha [Bacteroidetes bacterium]|jgi:pyruvate dehydrogenase E1 component alpha subunit|nr:pyruvate dehydrogenase (acetyl-transferring) E1 component subunit alpha [Bacteroidota bacterium]
MSKKPAPAAESASRTLGLPKETLLAWYDDMLLVRRFEEKAAQLYGMGRIGGFCHLYNGQEAISTGACAVLTPDDYIITAYRDHGLAISRGVDPKACMAELLGKYTGTTKGKGGSMHFFDREKNFLGGHAIVGSHVPIGAGVGFAIKYKGQQNVILVFMGDGATNIGAFFEALGLAQLWKLPVVFIIENNRYSMGTSVTRSSPVEDLYKKALAFDMRWDVVDGMNVLEVYQKVKQAADIAKKDYLPSLLEIRTYRYRGHSMSDPIHGHYRTKEEVEEQKRSDPITLFASILQEEGLADESYFESVEKRVKKVVEDCVTFADQSPEPPLEELWKDVYLP